MAELRGVTNDVVYLDDDAHFIQGQLSPLGEMYRLLSSNSPLQTTTLAELEGHHSRLLKNLKEASEKRLESLQVLNDLVVTDPNTPHPVEVEAYMKTVEQEIIIEKAHQDFLFDVWNLLEARIRLERGV